MTLKILKTIACTALIAAAIPTFALESDRSKPIEIEADQGSLDQANQSPPSAAMSLSSKVR